MSGSEGQFGRRGFMTAAAALSASMLLGRPRTAAAKPPPETTTIRLVQTPGET